MIASVFAAMASGLAAELLEVKQRIALTGNLRGMEWGWKYSADLRKLDKEGPRSNLASRLPPLNRIRPIAWASSSTTMLL